MGYKTKCIICDTIFIHKTHIKLLELIKWHVYHCHIFEQCMKFNVKKTPDKKDKKKILYNILDCDDMVNYILYFC